MLLADELLEKGISAVLLVPDMKKLTQLRSTYNTSFEQHLSMIVSMFLSGVTQKKRQSPQRKSG